MRLTPCRIVIVTNTGPGWEVVDAEVAWPLAIHPTSSRSPTTSWTVTHIPTGNSVMNGRGREAALELMTQCLEVAPPERWVHVAQEPVEEIWDFIARKRDQATAGAHRNGGTP